MRMLIRFLLFDRPDRQSTTQVHADIEVIEPPRFSYRQTVHVGPDGQSRSLWPTYVVVDITHGKQIDDPEQPGHKALVLQVYLAKKSEWPLFEMPEHVRQMMGE